MAGEYIEFNNNSQPALNDTNVNQMQRLIKQDITGQIGGDTLPVGSIVEFGGSTIPANWLLCNGRALSRTIFQDLFDVIGTNYGQGDGFSTFNIPNITSETDAYIIKAKQSAGIVATVIDSLSSISTTDALSAKQGKVLNEKINEKFAYSTTEKVIGTWIDNKPLYQKVIDFGALPNNTNKQVAHNINNLGQIVKFSGFAGSSINAGGIPIPHAVSSSPVTGFVDDTYVNITTTSDRTAYTRTVVILEYTKTTD